MTLDKTRHEKNEEVEAADEAKENAEHDDPQFMPNIVPQTGDDDDSSPAERATKPENT